MKKLKDSKLLKWAKKAAPKAFEVVKGIASGNPIEAVGTIIDVIKKENPDNLSPEDLEHALSLKNLDIQQWNLHLQDLEGARKVFLQDSWLQKTFAIVFLIGYMAISGLMLYGVWKIAIEKVAIENYLVAIVTSLFTAMSSKINTMVDFLFGGSIKPSE